MEERGCRCWMRMNNVQLGRKIHKDAHGAKEMQLELSQQIFICDDVKGDFDKYRKIGDGIYGMKMLKQKMREKMEGSSETPGGAVETIEKLKLNSS